jgi:hypothetical protein
MGNQAHRNSGLTVWRGEIAAWVVGLRNHESRLFTKPEILIPEIRAESFLSRLSSFAVRIRPRRFTFGRQRVSLKSDSRSGSDAQQRSEFDCRG